MTHAADQLSFDRMMVAQPVWNRFTTAEDALGLPRKTLLHAGPPFTGAPCTPILNSACVAAVYEGLVASFDEAAEAITSDDIRLEPAQNYGVVTPLAAVVSASMPLHLVYDAQRGKAHSFAPINGGNAPSLRLGLRDTAVLDHIRWVNGPVREAMAKGLGEGIGLLELAVKGLTKGDDCHGYTPAANAALVSELQARTRGVIPDDVLSFLQGSPSMFLNLWMAATKCMMRAADGVTGSSFVTAAGGNGVDTGIQISGLPGRWFTAKAVPPKGDLGDVTQDRALPAIGDSAVVEALGLGAMAIHLSAVQTKNLGAFLPSDKPSLLGDHPDFQALGAPLGLSARDVVHQSSGAVIGLGILDNQGEKGRIGGGIYQMPVEPFADALAGL